MTIIGGGFIPAMFGRGGGLWTPASPTTDGGVSPHTWHYAGSDGLYQDSAKTTVADADGDPIGASVNQGSDSHDIVQATTANKPTLKLNVLNGEPVFRCDGGDWLQGAFNSGSLALPNTVFVVAQLTGGVDNDVAYSFYDGASADTMLFFKSSGQSPDAFSMYASGGPLHGDAADSNWNILTSLWNGASSALWRNGGSAEATGDAGSATPDGLTLGARADGTLAFVGDIAEFLIYDSNLSDTDKNQVSSYLADKYGLSYTDIV